MHSRSRALRLLIALVALIPATVGAASAEQPKLASLRLGDSPYEIARPALWLQGPIQGESVLSSWVESDTFLYPLMSVTLEPLEVPGESGVNRLVASLPKSFPDYKELQANWVEIGGIRTHRSVVTWFSIFGPLKASRMLIPWKDKVFVVTFADLESTFGDHAELYDLCFSALAPYESVEVKDKKP